METKYRHGSLSSSSYSSLESKKPNNTVSFALFYKHRHMVTVEIVHFYSEEQLRQPRNESHSADRSVCVHLIRRQACEGIAAELLSCTSAKQRHKKL